MRALDLYYYQCSYCIVQLIKLELIMLKNQVFWASEFLAFFYSCYSHFVKLVFFQVI